MFRFVIFLVLLVFAQFAAAERSFPEAAKRGEWTSSQYPNVTISGKRYQLAPGIKVYDKDNRIIFPTAYPSNRMSIAYQQDLAGGVTKIWLLTTDEQRNFDKKKK
jgi:hypothetical protein